MGNGRGSAPPHGPGSEDLPDVELDQLQHEFERLREWGRGAKAGSNGGR
jgi:hypothetical protein